MKNYFTDEQVIESTGESLPHKQIHDGWKPTEEEILKYASDHAATKDSEKRIQELQAHVNQLREALRLSTNGLRTVSRWSISEETEKAITTQIIENENALSSSPTQSLAEHDNATHRQREADVAFLNKEGRKLSAVCQQNAVATVINLLKEQELVK